MRKLTPEDEDYIIQHADRTNVQLASELHCCRELIRRIKRKHGIKNKPRLITAENEQDIVNRCTTRTLRELANEYNCSAGRIGQVLKKYGLPQKESRKYHLINQDYFHIIDKPEKAYYLGLIGSDGCLFKPNQEKYPNKQCSIRISLIETDKDILIRFAEELETNKPLSFTSHNGHTYASIEISSNQIFDDLISLGLSPRKTYSNCIAVVPDYLMPHFIRGYCDGDGCISDKGQPDNDILVSISGYKNNLMKIINYLASRNIFCSFAHDKRKYQHDENNPFGFISFSNRTSKYAMLKLIYENHNDCLLQRKHKTAMKFIETVEMSTTIRDKQIVIYYKYAVRSQS